jgi:hypothetical protein
MNVDGLIGADSVAPPDRRPSFLRDEQLLAVETIVDLQVTHTWEQIARRLGIAVETLYRWRRDPAFQAELTRRSRALLRGHLPAVYQALIDKATRGDTTAIKLFLELTGEYQEAGYRDLLGAWLTVLSVAGVGPIRKLVALAQSARETGAAPGTTVDAVVIEDEGDALPSPGNGDGNDNGTGATSSASDFRV